MLCVLAACGSDSPAPVSPTPLSLQAQYSSAVSDASIAEPSEVSRYLTPINIPVFEGQKGHPTIFPRRLLQDFPQGMTLRDVVYGNPPHVRLTDVADPGVVLDMDTPADYQAMLDLLKPLKPETASNVTRENILRLVDMK